jgi:hypothetical protein
MLLSKLKEFDPSISLEKYTSSKNTRKSILLFKDPKKIELPIKHQVTQTQTPNTINFLSEDTVTEETNDEKINPLSEENNKKEDNKETTENKKTDEKNETTENKNEDNNNTTENNKLLDDNNTTENNKVLDDKNNEENSTLKQEKENHSLPGDSKNNKNTSQGIDNQSKIPPPPLMNDSIPPPPPPQINSSSFPQKKKIVPNVKLRTLPWKVKINLNPKKNYIN